MIENKISETDFQKYNIILNLFYNSNIQKKLIKKIKLDYFVDGKIIENNRLKKKSNKVTKVIQKLKLGEYEYLFFKDFPLNVYINLGFIIGDMEEVYKVTLFSGVIYYTNKENLKYIQEEIKKKEKINPRELQKKKIKLMFEQCFFIKSVKEYTEKINNIKLNIIHLVKGKGFRTFCPNKYILDFKIAQTLKIPLTNYIINNYIRDSNIHIKDYKTINSIIKPYLVLKEEEILNVDKDTNKIAIRDISREYYLKIDSKELIEKIDSKYFLNSKKLYILNRLKNHEEVRLTNPVGEVILPLWFCTEEGVITFPNIKKLENILGLKFNPKNIQDMFLLCKNGKQARFEEKYLRDSIYIEQNVPKKIYFKKIDDLIVSLFLHKTPEYIVFKEDICKNQKKQTFSIAKKLLKILILKTIEYNKKPNPEYNKKEPLNLFFKSLKNHLLFLLDKLYYEENIREISKKFINIGNILLKSKSYLKYDNLYLFTLIINCYIELVGKIDIEEEQKLLKLYNDFFDNVEIKLRKSEINEDYERTILNFLKYIKNDFFVYFKNINLDLEGTKLKELKEIPSYDKDYKVNKKKLRENYPKNYLNILKYYHNLKKDLRVNLIEKGGIEYSKGNFSINLDKEYFILNKIFKDYKKVYEDERILILKNKE